MTVSSPLLEPTPGSQRGSRLALPGVSAELVVRDPSGAKLGTARVALEEIPSRVQVRLLALVCAELLRASLGKEPEPSAEPSTTKFPVT